MTDSQGSVKETGSGRSGLTRILILCMVAVILVLVYLLFFSKMGKLVSLEEVQQGIEAGYLNGTSIREISISERETDKKNREDWMVCRVVWDNGVDEHTQYYSCYARFDRQNGWHITGIQAHSQNMWTMVPIAGVPEEICTQDVIGLGGYVEEELWTVSTPSQVSITGRNTNLSNGWDEIYLTVVIEDVVMQASGNITLSYYYDQGWALHSVYGFDFLTAEYNESLIPYEAANSHKETLRTASFDSVGIDLSQCDSVIADLQPIPLTEEKGRRYIPTYRVYAAAPRYAVEMNVTDQLWYDGHSWTLTGRDVGSILLTDCDISGVWTGSYDAGSQYNEARVTISPSDGWEYSVTIEFWPKGGSTASPDYGRFHGNGKLDMETRELFINADGWEVQPEGFVHYDILGTLSLADMQIEGNVRANTFSQSTRPITLSLVQ